MTHTPALKHALCSALNSIVHKQTREVLESLSQADRLSCIGDIQNAQDMGLTLTFWNVADVTTNQAQTWALGMALAMAISPYGQIALRNGDIVYQGFDPKTWLNGYAVAYDQHDS